VQTTRESDPIAFGMSFPTGGTELQQYVKNLTHTDKPFPTSADFASQRDQHKACRTTNIDGLKRMRDDGTIDQDLFNELVREAISKGCHVDFSLGALAEAMGVEYEKEWNLLKGPRSR
jgi:hypothetical protein